MPVDLANYRLTDAADNLSRWAFPKVNLEPRQYLLVHASGQEANDYVDAAAHGFFSGPAAVGYESRPNDRTNFADEILTTLPAGTHAVYARFPFEIASVSLSYRVMFDEEVTLALVDDGSGADSVASDGVYTATIPHTASEPGQMLRWSVMATDTLGGQSRAPHFLTPTRAPEYFGTLVVDPSVTSEIPILHWYLEPGTERAADRVSGTRASLFYDGEFYDNVFVRLRDYVFDNVNLPAVMNYLAASVITQNNDQSAKNYYLYRDTEGTGEWLFLPWDVDLTFGLKFEARLLDSMDFDVNPAAGNQDEEYLKLNNPHAAAVDISGWQLRGGVEHVF